MLKNPFEARLNEVLSKIQNSSAGRYKHQPALNAVLTNMRDSGLPIPHRLVELNNSMLDEAVEAQFDNLPV
ncbi:hypothetical protein BVC71_03620 [Marivivens niveibacter]|uniref:Uncharacterized protein n=1 Tax=Marivivens niveibacter TaxID=1930667 RepID=A0A251X1V4_9RHOB|nr:hypothetical protein [Marivivens niveibacter]OUD10592.1 hypothetical protein BVC71_03620 [Marivivens niveibacter]